MIKTYPFDEAVLLDTTESQTEYLKSIFESGDARLIATALGVVARARGMTQVAADAGITRAAIYKALSPQGDPRLSTLLGVARALGFTIIPQAAAKPTTRRTTKKAAPKRAKRKAA